MLGRLRYVSIEAGISALLVLSTPYGSSAQQSGADRPAAEKNPYLLSLDAGSDKSSTEPPTGGAATGGESPAVSLAPSGPAGPKPGASEPKRRRLPAHVALRLRSLDLNLKALSQSAEREGSNLIDALFAFAIGGVSIAAGIASKDSVLPAYLYVFGAANIARGSLIFTLAPDPTEAALRFENMPMRSVSDVKLKLNYGTRALESLADQSRLARILDSVINLGAGAAVVPMVLMRDKFKFDTALDYFVVAGAGISILAGTVRLLTRTQAERRWSAYCDFRGRLKQEWDQEKNRRPRPSLEVQAVAVPIPGGVLGLVRGSL